MGFFPFYMDIEGRKCLVAGGGKVALRKVEKLLAFSPDITVVAPEVCEELLAESRITVIRRKFQESDIDGAFMVIGATDDSSVNAHISEICAERRIPVNIVDCPELCSFYFPSLIRKNNITVGISTEGRSPVLARFLRERIEAQTGDDIFTAAELLSLARPMIKNIFDDETERKQCLEDILKLCLEHRISSEKELTDYIADLKEEYEDKNRNKKQQACPCADGTC